MLKEAGRVVAVESDSIWVETVQKSTCNSCAAQKGCGYGLLNESGHARRNHLKVPVPPESIANYHCNDVVQLEFPESELVKGALVVYILPLLIMLLSAGLASMVFTSSVYSVLAAVLGLVLGFLLVASFTRNRLSHVQVTASSDPVQCIQAS